MDVEFDLKRNLIFGHGNGLSYSLSRQEILVLKALISANESIVSRDVLLEDCWEGKIVSNGSLNVAIRNIRLALVEVKSRMSILTVARKGYCLENMEPCVHQEREVYYEDSDSNLINMAKYSRYGRYIVVAIFMMMLMIFYYLMLSPYSTVNVNGIKVTYFGIDIDKKFLSIIEEISSMGAVRLFVIPDNASCPSVQIVAILDDIPKDLTTEYKVNDCET